MENKSNFSEIADRAKALADRHTTYNPMGHLVNIVSGFGPDGGKDASKLKEVAMPDDWLAAVAALPTISRPGLELLAKSMQSKGWVSMATALKFVEGEESLLKAKAQAADDDAASGAGEGAALLLARAEKELPGTIGRFAEGAGAFVQAAGGVLAFGKEKSLLVGKGLGAMAGLMRDLRKGGGE